MSDDPFAIQFARAVAGAFRREYPEAYEQAGDVQCFDSESVAAALQKPRDPKMGRLALPVFPFSKLVKAKPPEIAATIAKKVNSILASDDAPAALKAVAAGGFLNAQVDRETLAQQTIRRILKQGTNYADTDIGHGETQLVEYSSANIAKPFGIGHLRSTIIGNSLRRIYQKLGYEVVGINYLGDWGTQFGKMIVAWRMWGDEVDLSENALHKLLQLYVRFHREAEEDDSLNDRAREAFRALEQGEPEATALWEKFKDISMRELGHIYEVLGVEFDWITGESFLNDKMEAAVERLQRAGLTAESQGALVVPLEDTQLPPCLLKKRDGATLYATRELASLIYRWETYHFHESLYVVGAEQSDHFRQLLKVIELMEEAENLPESERMTGRVKHVEFGWVRFGEKRGEDMKRMSTRKGDIVFLQDVYETATTKAREIILEKNPSLKNIDDVARMIGVGAVIFAQLSVRRQKDVNLIWDDVLSFEGETGPYLQYTHARLCSLERMYGKEIDPEIDFALLDGEEEQRVVEALADFPSAIAGAARVYDPQVIAHYLIGLAGAFNRLYQRKDESGRIDKIISDDEALSAARMAVVKSVRTVLNEGLNLLGLKAPEAM